MSGRGFFYRGRHRAPSATSRKAAAVAVTGAVGFGLTQGTASAADVDWGPIIKCESGGNPKAQNPSSTASGLFQFINGTWAAFGGHEFAKTAAQASVAEQHIVANRAYAKQGFSPWNASKSCWSGKTSSPAKAKHRAPEPAAKVDTGRAADGTGRYTCDTRHLYFEACDPGNIGQVVEYPRYG